MTLSRTSRVLIGFLLLILAAFLWVNFLVRDSGFTLPFLSAAPAPSPQGAASAPQTPSVAPVPESDAARELEVLDLPFLVTEPPAEDEPVQDEAAESQEGPPADEARRATVNPFSPIIPRGGVQAAAPTPSARQQPRVITEVPVPSGPSRDVSPAPRAQAPRAPAPAPVTPGARAGTLPRALPGGTLGGTPGLLRRAIGASEAPSEDLGQVAAVREPEESPPDLQDAGEASRALAEPQLLAQPIDPNVDQSQRGFPMSDQAPLAAGTSSLSRYLRNNNVRFTGSVIGPVSVGVFRSSETPAPIVISLGQSLPDTEIVLTDLRGQQAELMLGDNTQILTLELRR
jgi:hypothetical protein